MFRSVMLRFVLPVAFRVLRRRLFWFARISNACWPSGFVDVELRAQLVMHSMEEPITELVAKGNEARLRNYLSKATADDVYLPY